MMFLNTSNIFTTAAAIKPRLKKCSHQTPDAIAVTIINFLF
jgi:hypothetical protein